MIMLSKTKSHFEQLSEIYARQFHENIQQVCVECKVWV